MKFVKGISLFFIFPLVVLLVGIGIGAWAVQFFYPGMISQEVPNRNDEMQLHLGDESLGEQEINVQNKNNAEAGKSIEESSENGNDQFQNVVRVRDTLNADTEYVLQERDLIKETSVETVLQIPGKYIGMNRELFLESMEEYNQNPPLSEVERGFVGLEVLSFSPERVVVQMNYEYVQPSDSFYLAVQDNEIVVLLEDMKTVFINTGIRLDELPETVQMKIMQMYYIEDEESLYNFLETYSS